MAPSFFFDFLNSQKVSVFLAVDYLSDHLGETGSPQASSRACVGSMIAASPSQ
jgi:hypothetical protein